VDAKLRAWWAHRQGLLNLDGSEPSRVLAQTGWARSVGGSNPYLTLYARARTGRPLADQAVADRTIAELPSARGCTYIVPNQDFAMALAVGRGFGEKGEIAGAKKHLGVTDEELERLCLEVVEALADGPLDPRALRQKVEVRDLGEAGKKRGVTSTLPLALTRLQGLGKILRQPIGGRLDTQRLSYALWPESPEPIAEEEAFELLARRYFSWIGPASMANFQWFSGLGVGKAKEAVKDLNLVPVEGDLLMLEDDADAYRSFEIPENPVYRLTSALDGIMLLRRDVRALIDPDDVPLVGSDSKQVGNLQDLSNNAILDRGRLIGLWEFDPGAGEIVWRTFRDVSEALREEIAIVERFVRDKLGDARGFSLDSPKSRQAALEALRQGQPVAH
jgi:hypothetical protein